MRPLRHDTLGGRHHQVASAVDNEEQKPNLRGFKVYIGDFVDVDDPGNDPPGTSPSSPPFVNGFGYLAGAPLWFAHGLDGETDMGGMYDLVTGGPSSGDVAWTMPSEWRAGAQAFTPFVALVEAGATEADDKFAMALQRINPLTGAVRVYWPLYATALP